MGAVVQQVAGLKALPQNAGVRLLPLPQSQRNPANVGRKQPALFLQYAHPELFVLPTGKDRRAGQT